MEPTAIESMFAVLDFSEISTGMVGAYTALIGVALLSTAGFVVFKMVKRGRSAV